MKKLSLNSPDQLAQYLANSTASVFTNKINEKSNEVKTSLDTFTRPTSNIESSRVVYVLGEFLIGELDLCGKKEFNEDKVAAGVASITALAFAYRTPGEPDAPLKKALQAISDASASLCAFDALIKEHAPKD